MPVALPLYPVEDIQGNGAQVLLLGLQQIQVKLQTVGVCVPLKQSLIDGVDQFRGVELAEALGKFCRGSKGGNDLIEIAAGLLEPPGPVVQASGIGGPTIIGQVGVLNDLIFAHVRLSVTSTGVNY